MVVVSNMKKIKIKKSNKNNKSDFNSNILKNFSYSNFLEWQKTLDLNKKNLILILNNVEDVHNFGAIIRTAAAVGARGIIVEKVRQAPVNETVLKTSAFNLLKIPIVEVSNINQAIEKMKERNFWIYGLDMFDKNLQEVSVSDNIFQQKFDKNTVLVLGSEGKGLAELVKKKCDFIVSIPMENQVESLNVSVSAAVAMYEWKRQNS